MDTRENYEIERNRHITVLQGFVLLPEEEIYALPDETIDHIETVIERVEAVSQILDAIDSAVGHEQARLSFGSVEIEPPAQKSQVDEYTNLELLNDVARHLSGKDIEVRTGPTRRAGWAGACSWNAPGAKHAVTVTINPDSVPPGGFLRVFLHEVAHARQHDAQTSNNEALKGQVETEATGLGWKWEQYAGGQCYKYQNNGGGSAANDNFRSKLFALLYSDEAPFMTIAKVR